MTGISIGLPVFNGQDLVEHAIDSILDQSYTNFELVISDNASIDRTEEICRAYAARDSRVRYHRNEYNIGAAANFRHVVQLSSAPYFKWIGVDDYIDSTYLEQSKQILDNRRDVVLCCSKVEIVDENNNRLREYEDVQEVMDDSPRERFKQYLQQDSWVNAVYGLMRRDALERTSIMGSFTGSDVVVMAEMTLYGKFFELPEILFYRRFHPDAYSYDCDAEKQQDFYNPGKKRRSLVLYRWRHLLEHYRSIRRAAISPDDARALLLYLVKTANWHKKDLLLEMVEFARYRR